MQFYQDLGFLIFGSRLKRLSEYYLSEINKIYQQKNIPFDAHWFPIFYLLSKNPSLSLVDIANQLQTSHSAVSQLINNLRKKKWVQLVRDENDGRKQLVTLTEEGTGLLKQIEPLWDEISQSIHPLIKEDQRIAHVLDGLTAMESLFKEESLSERILQNKIKPIKQE